MQSLQMSLTKLESAESHMQAQASATHSDLLYYFRYIQETILLAFDNGGNPIPIPNTSNNPMLFTFVSTTRAFALCKAAMDQTLRGYPFVGIALTRILAELAQCNQYLVRHPDLIDAYVTGKVKLDRILKLAKKETASEAKDYFGRFTGIMSEYIHPSPDFLAISLQITGNELVSTLVVTDQDRIEDAAYGLMVSLLTQYLIFRLVFLKQLDVSEELNARDKFIFDPDNVRKYAKFGAISGDDLIAMYKLITGESDNALDRGLS